jgi:hypothetical protein
LQINGELQQIMGQLEINKEEAKTDMFRGGWRPATGSIIRSSIPATSTGTSNRVPRDQICI